MDCTHSDTGQESQAKTVPSATAEEIQGLTSNPEYFLFRGHRKCIDTVHLSVVWKRLKSLSLFLSLSARARFSVTVRSHRTRRERQSGRKSFIFNEGRRRAPARAARHVLDDESVEESLNQVNFMVMSYDAVGRQPIRM